MFASQLFERQTAHTLCSSSSRQTSSPGRPGSARTGYSAQRYRLYPLSAASIGVAENSDKGNGSRQSTFSQQRQPAQEKPEAKRNSVIAQARKWARSSQHKDKDEGLPTSLFTPFEELPPEGRSIAVEEESCNPEERRCKTPIHVWESKCKACSGTGEVSSRSRRGSRSAYTCLACHGVGYLRRASSRIIPDLSNGAVTLGRSGPEDIETRWGGSEDIKTR